MPSLPILMGSSSPKGFWQKMSTAMSSSPCGACLAGQLSLRHAGFCSPTTTRPDVPIPALLISRRSLCYADRRTCSGSPPTITLLSGPAQW